MGGLRHRGAEGRRLRHPDQDPPRHHRRRLRSRAADDHARLRPRGWRARPRPGRLAAGSGPEPVRARAADDDEHGAQPRTGGPAGRGRGRGDGPRPATGRSGRHPRSAPPAADPAGAATEQRDRPPVLPRVAAPPTPFNRTISPHRRFAMGSVALDDVKLIKNHLGVTLNDVVMAVCAGALRRYLLAARRAARRPAGGHGPGVDPQRRRDRQVDQPGVGDRRPPAHGPGATRSTGFARCTTRWWRPRSSSTCSRPT